MPDPLNPILPQPSLVSEIQGQEQAIGQGLIGMTGIPDAYQAFTGQMTPEEAQMFALGAIPGLIPGARAEESIATAATKGIRAFHASPHDFSAFDMSKIGTGEGAQVYGHGLYFAENPDVAEEYYKQFEGRFLPGAATGRSKYLVGGQELPTGISGHAALDTAGEMDMLLGIMHSNPESTMIPHLKQTIERRIANNYSMQQGGSAGDDMRALADFYEKNVKNAQPGDVSPRPTPKRYEVDIKADPEHFMDWSLPIDKQSKHVQEALKKVQGALKPTIGPDTQWQSGKYGLYLTDKGAASEVQASYADIKQTAHGYFQVQSDGNRGIYKTLDEAKAVAEKYVADSFARSNEGRMGQHIIGDLERGEHLPIGRYNPKGAMEALRDAGIKGIRYEDQGSRQYQLGEKTGEVLDRNSQIAAKFPTRKEAEQWIKDNTTYNYVVFDDKLIDIVKKYGLAGLITSGALDALSIKGQEN